jgi:Na+-translocating ferredoxin:NAD+ oxidoreductase RnfG subunit
MQPPSWMLMIPVAVISTSAYATTYLTVEQAQAAIFPGATLTKAFFTLTPEQKSAIEKKSGVNVLQKDVQLWKAADGAYFIVDQVVGKHEFFTIAVGLNTDGSVKQIEIMDYRETYGYEVRNESWRQQFVGKTSAAHLKLTDDIKNIGGATLSCKHVTDAVKRLLVTYDTALKPS